MRRETCLGCSCRTRLSHRARERGASKKKRNQKSHTSLFLSLSAPSSLCLRLHAGRITSPRQHTLKAKTKNPAKQKNEVFSLFPPRRRPCYLPLLPRLLGLDRARARLRRDHRRRPVGLRLQEVLRAHSLRRGHGGQRVRQVLLLPGVWVNEKKKGRKKRGRRRKRLKRRK